MTQLTIQSEVFTRGVEDVVTRAELEALLTSGKPLRIKHGIDLTGELHIGHATTLWKLRALQDAGHKAVILLGDYTTKIGDPTGKSKARAALTETEIKKNLKIIERQVKSILKTDPEVFELHKSSEWYSKMKIVDFLKLLAMVTHARLIERDMFQKRMAAREEIYMSEMIYPVLQGYDSVMLKSDMTVIGSDQLFNEHMGRAMQEKFGQRPQILVALKILPGLDGGEKMSKSVGNYIGLSDTPKDKFGKTMRIPDELIIPYFEVYTDALLGQIEDLKKELATGMSPRDAKLGLAEAIVRRYHGEAIAKKERAAFFAVFSKGETPEDLEAVRLREGEWDPVQLLSAAGLVSSKSEARRLLLQRGVTFDGVVVDDVSASVTIKKGSIVRVGKRRGRRIA